MMLRLSAVVIALVGGAGLAKKAWLPEKRCIRAGFFVYYTHLSNLLAAAYELALGLGAGRWLESPGVALSMTLCIYVTHLIYAFVLIPSAKRRGDADWLEGRYTAENLCVHYVTPGLVVAQWLLWQDKSGLTAGDAARWLVLPVAYFVFVMLRARTGRPIGFSGKLYPYPFLDIRRLGAKRFWMYVVAILTFFFALGCLFVGISRLFYG